MAAGVETMNSRPLLPLFLATFLFFSVLAAAVQARDPFPIDELWRTDAFRKAITASYGVDARIEPPVDLEEKKELGFVASQVEAGNRASAIQMLTDSVRLDKSPSLQFTRANLLFEEGQSAEAIRGYERALALYQNFRDAHRNLAVAHVEGSATDKARPHLLRAVELGARDGTTLGLLGYVHSKKGHHQAALQAYRMAQLTQPEVVQWKRGEAHSLQALGQSKQADAIFQTLVELDPTRPALWLGLADARIADSPESALVSLEWVRRLGSLDANGLHALGTLYLREGLATETAACLGEALAASPPLDRTKAIELIESTVASGAFEATESMLALLRSSGPNVERVRALVELERGDRDAGARRVEALIQNNPLDAPSLILLARFRLSEGKPQEASLLFEQAARDPKHAAEALRRHGELQVRLRDIDRALLLLERSEALHPDPSLRAYINLLRP